MSRWRSVGIIVLASVCGAAYGTDVPLSRNLHTLYRVRPRKRIQRLYCAVASLILLAATPVVAQINEKPQYGAWGLDLTAMDSTVKPGDDFGRYASGAWLERTAIPDDQSSVSLRSGINDRIEAQLHEMMERPAADVLAEPATLPGKVRAFYKAFMNTDRIEALGATPIGPELAAVRSAVNHAGVAALMGRTNTDFEGSIFGLSEDVDLKHVGHYAIYIGQAGLGMPDRDYYLKQSFAQQKAAYQAYVAKLLTLIAWPDPDANAAAVVAFETRVAQVSWTKVEQRDADKTYNPMTRAELEAYTPGFAWRAFLKNAQLQDVNRVVVSEKTAFPRIAAVYADTPIDVIKAWAAFTITDNAAFYLSSPFSQARFEFRDKTLSGQPEEAVRWKRAIHAVSGGVCNGNRVDCFGNIGFAVGQLYTAQFFPAPVKAKIEELVANLKAAFRRRLQGLDWMSPATKIEALKKLDSYQIKVGYPDHPRDYSRVQIRVDDVIGDVRRAAEGNWRFYVGRLNGPVDRSDWSMTPQTNNAYNGSLNDIVFPAGLLQPPMFDPAADAAINYGAIGAGIGHELTHGFDDQGRKLDANGKLRDWWSPADAAAFEARAKLLGLQFSTYEPVPGVHINGDLTMGENIADLGGLNIALEAYHRSLHGGPAPEIDGFTGDQRVFLGWAQAWRGKTREAYVRKQVASDPHSPRAFRVIGPMRNIDAWYAAFGVKPGAAYYLAPDQRVRIW
jgi:putative endopeptidase